MTALSIEQQAGPGIGKLAMPWIGAAILLAVLPHIFNSGSAITIMNQMAITIVFALAYNMILGQGGMLSFGHAVYMGIGGFFSVHVLNMVEYEGWQIPLILLPVFGAVMGLIFAMVVGAFSTRRAGTVFAMISLGVGELIAASSVIIVVFFGGEEGVSGDRTMGPTFFGYDFASQIEVYYLTAFWLLLSALCMYLFSRTPAGRMANAVRDNEERAEFLGYSQQTVRYISFCASGLFAGIAGSLFAINYEILTEENLNLATSGSILLITFLGGVGFFIGPIVGAIVFTLVQTVMGLHTELWALYAGILFLATVMYFPFGLTGLLAIHVPAMQAGKLGLLASPYIRTGVPGLITILSTACLLEVVFHARHAAEGLEMMSLFGVEFDSTNPVIWGSLIIVMIAAGWLTKKGAPSAIDAFETASMPTGGNG